MTPESLNQKLKTRRARNIELSRMDSANRCPICRKAFSEKTYERLGDPQRYCSTDCVETAIEREVKE